MSNSRLKIARVEFLTSTDHDDEFHVTLLFDPYIHRLMCTHMGSGDHKVGISLKG